MAIAIIFSAASLVLWAFSFLFFFSYLKRRTGQERILAEFREEVNLITADIDDVTVRNVDLLEDRIKTLRSLSEETERRIRTLVRELDRRDLRPPPGPERRPARDTRPGPAPAFSEPVAAPAAAFPGPVAVSAAAFPGPVAASAAAFSEPVAASAPAATEAPGTAVEPRAAPLPEGKGPSFAEQVAELYREGLSPDSIATRLDAPMAKVNLAIAMAEPRGH
jgi:hypothetical protein